MTLEVVDYFRSGLLIKWLKTRGESSIVDDLNKINTEEDRGIFEGVCAGLGVAVDKDVLDCIFLAAPEKIGKNLSQFCDLSLSNDKIEKVFFSAISAVIARRIHIDSENVLNITIEDVLKDDDGPDDIYALYLVFDWLDDILKFVNLKYPSNSSTNNFTILKNNIFEIYCKLFMSVNKCK